MHVLLSNAKRKWLGLLALLFIVAGIAYGIRYVSWTIWHSPPQQEVLRSIYYLYSRQLVDLARSGADLPAEALACIPPEKAPVVFMPRCLGIEGNINLDNCPGKWKFDNCASVVVKRSETFNSVVGELLVDVLTNPCKYVRDGDRGAELYGHGIYVDLFGCKGEDVAVSYNWSVVIVDSNSVMEGKNENNH